MSQLDAIEIVDAGGPRRRSVSPCIVELFKDFWDSARPDDRRTILDLMNRYAEAKKIPGVAFNGDNKYDIQLSEGLVNERRLADVFANKTFERSLTIELKSESWQWERTGNIAVEFSSYGRPSGIAVTEADFWVHELKRDGDTLVYLMFPIERLKMICRDAFKAGKYSVNGGDNDAQSNILLSLEDIIA